MPPHRCLRPIILPAAHHLPPTPHRRLCSPLTHQHHHRRITATLRPPDKSQSRAFFAASAIAALFGAVLWLRPQRSTNATKSVPSHEIHALDAHILEAFHKYFGCQHVILAVCSLSELTSSNAPDDVAAQFADLQMGVFLDGDTTSENVKGNIIGFCMASEGREEIELILLLQKLLMDFDSGGGLKRQGKAVCLVSCKGVDGI